MQPQDINNEQKPTPEALKASIPKTTSYDREQNTATTSQANPVPSNVYPPNQAGYPTASPVTDTLLPDKKQRINRKTYIASVVISDVFVAILVIFLVIGALSGGNSANLGGFGWAVIITFSVLLLYWLLIFLRASVYRCFDIGISQFWVLLFLIPLLYIPVFLYLCFKGGQPMPNKHGNVPQGLQLKRTLPFIPQ